MGKSVEREDWLGNRYTEHYDDSGNKIGESRELSDRLGNKYTEHRDTSGTKTGESHERTDWLGGTYTEHTDRTVAAPRRVSRGCERTGSGTSTLSIRMRRERGRVPRTCARGGLAARTPRPKGTRRLLKAEAEARTARPTRSHRTATGRSPSASALRLRR